MVPQDHLVRKIDAVVDVDFIYCVLAQGIDAGFVDPSFLFIDSTHIKANANKRKYKKKFV